MPRYGALPEDWTNLDLALGLTADLLPVVSNPTSPVSPKSSLKQIGKVPSLYNKNRQITGISEWTQKQATSKEIERWSQEPDYGICIQTRRIRALDIDVSDRDKVSDIVEFIGGELNWLGLPLRSRSNSSKCLLAFEMLGEFPKRVMKVEGGIIEFLANGQQFIAHGTHPSGVRYEWDWLEHETFPVLQIEEFEALWGALVKRYALETPSESSLRNPLSGDGVIAALNDPIAEYLGKLDHITGIGKEGQVFIRCPFEHEHTEQIEGGTSTAYLPAGNRDYAQGHFSCLHSHCASREDEDFLDAIGYRAADFEIIPNETTEEEARSSGRFDIVKALDFSKKPPVNWLIKGILPEKGAYQFYGPSGAGKTFAVLDMVLSLCRGINWNGHKTTKKCKVVYICAEGAGGFISRLKVYAHEYKIDLGNVDLGIIADTPNFRDIKDIRILAEKIRAFGEVDIIIVDTLAQVTAGADENSGKDMSIALKHCDELRRLTGAASGLIHHAGKDLSRGARGWSGIKAVLDAEFCISKKEDGTHNFWVDKMKDGPDGFGYDFELASIIYGEDTDGDPLSSCVVNYVGKANSKISRPALRSQNKNEILVYTSFADFGSDEVKYTKLEQDCMVSIPITISTKYAGHKELIAHTFFALCEKGELHSESGLVSAPL